jgi:YVTN family beta-propeller protein
MGMAGAGPPAPDGGAPPYDGGTTAPATARKLPTQGSAVAVTADDKYAVAVNRTAGRVTVFRLDFGSAAPATKVADLDVGKTAEPWAVVIGNDDDTAYVILRKEQRLVRITSLRSYPAVDAARAHTGAEPTGLAISPTGATVYVANWAEGTVTVVDAASLVVTKTIDLNAALAGSGLLGEVQARPAMAHPRAIVVTNDGDASDANEHVYVTEFFSQARTDALPLDDSRFDVARQGVIYSFDAAGAVAPLITIAPVADTGFSDSRGQKTGCFPNQLYAATINAGRLYVTSVCESPRGPVGPDAAPVAPGTTVSNFKTQVHAAVFVVDLATNKELPPQGLLLTREFDKLYDKLKLAPEDAGRRMPLVPNDIMFAAGSTFAYVTAYGSDAVFRVAYKSDGTLETVGASAQPFINLKPAVAGIGPGELPVGIASANGGFTTVPFAVAVNENSRNLSVISFGSQAVLQSVPAADPPAAGADTAINRGQKLFSTGLARWSLNGQAWNACVACHPDGLTDNVTWFFARGPRQTISLDGSYDPKDPSKRRVLNWSAIFDELHDFENNTRGNSGGVGAFVHRPGPPVAASDRIVFDGTPPAGEQQATATSQLNLNGSMISMMAGGPTLPNTVLPDWDQIDGYVKAIRAPRGPTNLVAAEVTEGKKLFDANGCAGCHGGSQWTLSQVFYTPNEENNKALGLLRTTLYTRPAGFPMALNPPAAATGTAPLRFDGINLGANDQLNCVLRDVGTLGLAPAGVPLKEVRQDMMTPSQGATGFNIPSLLGMVTGAPYFHGGSARTLEEALGDTFDVHRRAFAENFRPSATQLRQLTSFLLSVDEDATPPTPPLLGFSFDLCAQVPPGIIK